MPTPFPGMDPFIEGQIWADFHHEFLGEIRYALVRRLPAHYSAVLEERVYIDRADDEGSEHFVADMAIAGDVEAGGGRRSKRVAAGEAVLLEYPVPEERRETFLTIRSPQSREIVIVLEVLSPANKRAGGEGRAQYLEKREAILGSEVNLVELDLLRGGRRLPMAQRLPSASYFALVRNPRRRQVAAVYPWRLSDRLPPIPIPLSAGDADVTLDLQTIFASSYERAGYEQSLDYDRPVMPPLSADEAKWTAEVLAAAKHRGA
jgi:hypothetical protein